MLTVKEVAGRLETSVAHVRTLIHSGRLRAIDVGTGGVYRYWRIPEEAVLDLMRCGESSLTLGIKTR